MIFSTVYYERSTERLQVSFEGGAERRQASKQGWRSSRDRDFLRAFLIVVLGTIDAIAHRVLLHQFRIKWFEAICNSLGIRDSGIKPAIVVFFFEYGRHPVVHFGHQ